MSEFDLLSAVQPDGGYYALVGIHRNGQVIQRFAESREDADKIIKEFDGDSLDTYFGVAKYTEEGSRKKSNVKALKSIWMDIDCGKGKPFDTKSDGLKALKDFCANVGLPKPILVDSGRGIHAYWPLDKELVREEWEPLAERLRDICKAQEFDVDPAVFEAARVLRVPGTHNYKDDPAPVVSMLSTGDPAPVDVDWLRSTLGVIDKMKAPKRELTALGKKMAENQQTSFAKIMRRSAQKTGCQQLLDCFVNQTQLSEPRWFNALSIAKFCSDKDSAIHKMSEKHPDYDPDKTEGKISHIVGPHTCVEFDKHNPGGCHGCPNFGKIKSPIVLGREIQAADSEEVLEDNDEEEQFKIPSFPSDFFRGKVGGIYKRAKSDEEEPMLVYENDLYIVKRMDDPNHGEVYLLRLHLPKDGVKSFVVPARVFVDKTELKKTLASKGVMFNDNKFPYIAKFLIDFAKDIQNDWRAEKMRQQFGWADGDSKFIWGDREITGTGVFHSPPSTVTEPFVEALQPVGSLEKWKEVFDLYGRDGHEPFAFAALTGFGAPLIKFLKYNGAIINVIHPKSGTGKTTILHMCNSIYGDPDALCSTWEDTFNAKIFRLGVMNNMPFTIDEITNMKTTQFSSLSYSMSQGRGKDRMKGSSNEMRINHTSWQTISLCSSNASFSQKLASEKASPEGELMRLLEYKIDHAKDPIPAELAKDMFDRQLMENYGHAAEPYIEYILKNMEEVKAELMSIRAKVDKEGKLAQKERFWSAVVAANITGGLIAKRLGLINWDMKKIYLWALDMMQEMREEVTTPVDDATSTIGTYLNSHVNNVLVVDDNAHANAKFKAFPSITPVGELLIRYEPDTRFMYISRSEFRNWCVKQQIDVKELLKDLRDKGVQIDTVTKRLSKGMKLNTPPVAALRILASHPDFVDMDTFVEANAPEEEVEEQESVD